MRQVTLAPEKLTKLHTIDERMISYNVEMTEVTGGTFWKSYTPEQVSGEEEFHGMTPEDLKGLTDFMDLTKLMEVYPPINLYDEHLRHMAKELGTAWVRVSGTWATQTYYDFDGTTGGKAPEGFRYVLTREQWTGVLDFIKAINAKLLISVANSAGVHNEDGSWNPEQAKLLFDFSKNYGVPIAAAEFMNEPNSMAMSGAPEGYDIDDFARDQDLFFNFVRENYPEVLLVGPCGAGDPGVKGLDSKHENQLMLGCKSYGTDEMLEMCKEPADVFSYHYYNGISERGAFMGGHWDASEAHTDRYLAEAGRFCRVYLPMRDKFTPDAQMWVTETAGAACGGNTWDSTFLDVFRYTNELGEFSQLTDGVLFHNTFCSSDYGFLDPKTHEARPNYWVGWLWNRIVGTTVYSTGMESQENLHIYAHSRRDGKDGCVYMMINNSLTDKVSVTLPAAADRYTLSAEKLRSREMLLNGKPLAVGANGEMPKLCAAEEKAGVVELAPATVTFFVM